MIVVEEDLWGQEVRMDNNVQREITCTDIPAKEPTDIASNQLEPHKARMTAVKKDINETSAKISQIRSIVRQKRDRQTDLLLSQTPTSEKLRWNELPISHPKKRVRIGSVFSGIGAV